jgi:hypothetical protein
MFKWREWRGLKGEQAAATAKLGTLVDVLFDGDACYQRMPAANVDWSDVRRAPALWRPAQN